IKCLSRNRVEFAGRLDFLERGGERKMPRRCRPGPSRRAPGPAAHSGSGKHMDVDAQTTAPAPPPHAEFFPPPRSARGPSRWLAGIADDARQIARFWPVIQNMVVQELRVRYQRSMLGFLWTLLNPILMMATLTLVFSQLFGITRQRYAVYLFAGMVPWSFLN